MIGYSHNHNGCLCFSACDWPGVCRASFVLSKQFVVAMNVWVIDATCLRFGLGQACQHWRWTQQKCFQENMSSGIVNAQLSHLLGCSRFMLRSCGIYLIYPSENSAWYLIYPLVQIFLTNMSVHAMDCFKIVTNCKW